MASNEKARYFPTSTTSAPNPQSFNARKSSQGFDRAARRSAPRRSQDIHLAEGSAYFKSWSINRRGRNAGELRNPTDLRFLPGRDRIVVADSGNHRLQIFHGEASSVKLYDRDGAPCLNHPTTIELSKDLVHILTTDGDKVHFIDQAGKCTQHWEPTPPNKEERKVMSGMALDADGNFVISNFGAKQTVELYSQTTSKLMRTFNVEPDFRSPHYTTCNPKNRLIYVSDNEEGFVHVFDKRVKKCLRSFGNERSRRLISPHGMCIDSQGLLYVADKGQNAISVFNTDSFYQNLLSEEDGIKDPIAVSISEMKKLAVVEATLDVKRDKYALEVYKLDAMELQVPMNRETISVIAE